jgi:hypothetical protein
MTARQAGQQALAQDDTQSKIHFRVKVAPKTQPETKRDVTSLAVTANFYPHSEAFTATRYPSKNSDGSDLWPCLGNTSTPATDCPTVGDLSVTFLTGGGALGLSAHTWSLSACDGSTNGSSLGGTPTHIACGQMGTSYEDDSGDNASDLIYSISAHLQGEQTIEANVPVTTAMSISGHATFAMLKRYAISLEAKQQRNAMKDLQKYHEGQRGKVVPISQSK